MKKTLVKNEEQFMALFSDVEDIENILGIEFAYEDGTYGSDWVKGVEINEDQEISENIYRKDEVNGFPERYPCLVVSHIEDEFDRFGKVNFVMYELVYLEDFE